MASIKAWALLATSAAFLCAACGPTGGVDRVGLAIATGGSSGQPASDAGEGSGGAPGEDALGTGGGTGSSGGATGTGGAGDPLPGTGGDLGTGGAQAGGGTGGTTGTGGSLPGTGGASASPDAAGDNLVPRLEPVLYLSDAPGAASSNLTSAGKLDWMHWALGADAAAVNRKKGVTPLIVTRKLNGGSLSHYDNRPSAMTWTDGTPTTRATDATDGAVVGDEVGRGFEFKVPGVSARPRTLKLHLGGWQVAGKLTASIGGRSVTETLRNTVNPGEDRIYTIVYQPISDGETLTVRWTVDEVLLMYGNITVQAATLSE